MSSQLKRAKDKAWKAFSKYIRLKYAKNGYCKCVTCGAVKHWKEIHAGHFIDGRNNTVLFDERLVYPQCFHCNSKIGGCLAGNKVQFTFFMLQKHTLEELKEFENMKFKERKMTVFDFKQIEDEYLDKIVGLSIKEEK